ncbi:MAG: PAS domain S-box protein [Hyphomicrobiaceae bacterium]|nr:PAS domain S-box protein [Hyphomicrobiaceae bacterium]
MAVANGHALPVSLAESPSTPRQLRSAGALALVLLLIATLSWTAIGRPLPAITGPSFFTAYDALSASIAWATAFLLISQFQQTRSLHLLAVAMAFAFAGTLAAAHMLTIPGLLLREPLFGNDNATLWLRVAWLSALPLGAVAYLAVQSPVLQPICRVSAPRPLAAAGLMLAVALAVVTMIVASTGRSILPDLTPKPQNFANTYFVVLPAVVGLQVLALGALWRHDRGRTALGLWLGIALLAVLVETVIGWVLVGVLPDRRYSLNFFIARAVGLFAGSVVFLALLAQVGRCYRELVDAGNALQGRVRELSASDARLVAIVSSTSEAILTKGLDGTITSWNPAAERLLGYPAFDIVGQSVHRLIPSSRLAEEDRLLASIVAGERIERYDTERLGKDGRAIEVTLSMSPLTINDRLIGASSIMHDITERRQAEQALARHARRLDLLARLNDATRGLDDPHALVNTALEVLRQELGADRCAWAEVDADENHFVFLGSAAAEGVAPASGRFAVSAFGAEALRTMRTGGTFVCADATVDLPEGADRDAYKATGIRALIAAPMRKRGRFVGGTGVHQLTRREWRREEVALVEEVTDRLWEAIDRARAGQQLRRSHDLILRMIEDAPFGVYLVDSDLRMSQVSEGARKVLRGIEPLPGRDLSEIIRQVWPEPFATEVIERFRHTLSTGERYRTTSTQPRRNDGEVQSYDWLLERLLLPDGRAGVVCYFYDLTERQRYEEHIRLLLREVNHRSKNMLAVVKAIARQTAGASRAFLSSFSDRIEALATSHDLLIASEWQGVELGGLVTAELDRFQDLIRSRIAIAGPPLRLSPHAAQTIGMALHELATNAVKYGALANETGRIDVRWRLIEQETESRILLTWSEHGGPAVSPPERRGFGTTLMRDVPAKALDAEVELKFAPAGLHWSLDAPVGAVLDGPRSPGE